MSGNRMRQSNAEEEEWVVPLSVEVGVVKLFHVKSVLTNTQSAHWGGKL